MVDLYRNSGLEVYEKSHYSRGEHITEVEQILTWYLPRNTRVLDMGCSGGLHALEFAKRGFYVTGLDIEPSAIRIAKKRNTYGKRVRFLVVDIEKDDLSSLGKFDLIYSIGNVLSHIRKDHILNIFRKIRDCLDDKSIFLFNVLINARPFQEEIYPGDKDLHIIWKRKINEKTGKIGMKGIFFDFGFIQHFEVWGYTIEEMVELLRTSGFRDIECSEKLDFITRQSENPVSLYFRTKVEGFE